MCSFHHSWENENKTEENDKLLWVPRRGERWHIHEIKRYMEAIVESNIVIPELSGYSECPNLLHFSFERLATGRNTKLMG